MELLSPAPALPAPSPAAPKLFPCSHLCLAGAVLVWPVATSQFYEVRRLGPCRQSWLENGTAENRGEKVIYFHFHFRFFFFSPEKPFSPPPGRYPPDPGRHLFWPGCCWRQSLLLIPRGHITCPNGAGVKASETPPPWTHYNNYNDCAGCQMSLTSTEFSS